ncbi:MAG: UvrD-helicase domain-containing protein [Bacteroidales bacterium]|nr:UvrD-helicase domain-containing protein [Bacteroidales bacterium]
MENYLSSLNESQRAAVEYCDGPQLVIAGAGSGKTRVLTMKIAYLLTHGYRPQDIIALTFTKKAATEMQQRIQQIVGPAPSRRLWMGTFHSLFCRILRREAGRLGFRSDFTIYDQTDSRSLIKTIIKEMELDDKIYKPNSVQAQISNAKNNLITPGMYSANKELLTYDARSKRPLLHIIYRNYWNRCFQAGAMDFDDLLVYTNILFRDHPDVLEFYQQYFSYVLVDEYQDTNRAQHLIVEQLAAKHGHLCVVGDDAQSIYSFRGANIHNILDMQHKIPDTKLFKLEQNYRSTQNIVDAANSLIAKNKDQIRKTIFSENDRGSKLILTGTYSDLEESYQVAGRVQSLHDDQGYNYRDIAILYRTNAQSRTLEEALRKRNILYRIYGGLSFYQRKEIKDIISYLRLITNPADEEAFKRIVNYPARGIGQTTINKIAAIVATGKTFFDVCSDPEAHNLDVNKSTAAKLRGFTALIQHFQELNEQLNAYQLCDRVIVESGIKADLAQDNTVEAISRRENVQELLSAIQTFTLGAVEEGREVKLVDFLADVSLSGDLEPEGHDADDDIKNSDYVSLMTIHSAKGLEFKNVFIVGIEENLLPSEMSLNEPGGVEEERRLLYVAITRAEENCFMSYAKSRFRNGKSEASRPSRFIKDIDRQFIQQTGSPDSSTDYGSAGGGRFGFDYGGHSSFGTAGKEGRTIDKRNIVWHHPGDLPETQKRPEQKPSPLDLSGPIRKTIRPNGAYTEGMKPKATPASSESATITFNGQLLQAGTRIAHDRFGEGTITSVDGSNDNARISVNFDHFGNKTLLLKFAKIKVI